MSANANPEDLSGEGTPALGTELRVAVARVYSRFRSERGDGEMAEAAVIVLTALYNHGPQSLTELSRRARVTPSSMSQTVNRLVSGGHATRHKDPKDGRRVLFCLTPSGTEVAREALAVRQDWLEGKLAQLSEEERLTLLRASRIMRRLADS